MPNDNWDLNVNLIHLVLLIFLLCLDIPWWYLFNKCKNTLMVWMAVKTTLFVEIVMERNFWLRNLRTFNVNVVFCQQSICGELVILRQLKRNELNNWTGNIQTWTQGQSRYWKSLHHLVWKFVSNHNSIWLWDDKLTWVFCHFPILTSANKKSHLL